MKYNYNLIKLLFSLICALALPVSVLAQPGWNLLTPWPTNEALSAVSFIDANTGWIAASGDLILNTTDGGSSWSKGSTQSGQNWYAVYFADAQHGWIADTWGGVSVTTNGGNTWSPQAASSSFYLYAMQFTDALHGFVLLEQDSLLYTTNGGTSWNRIKIDATEYHYGMKFVNPGEGWICGSGGQILHSANGGISWTPQTTGVTTDLSAIDFTDNLHGWAAAYGTIDLGTVLRTTNGGTTWEKVLQNFNDKLTKIAFIDNLNGNAISNSGKIYHTTNGGITWTPTYTSPNEGLLDFQILPGGTGFLCGSSGVILKTTNSGISWTPLYRTATHGYTIRDISFPDQKHGWVLDDAGYLNHTADNGNTWNDQTPFASNFTAAAIHFSDSIRGWVVGQWPAGGYGQILRTTNGGAAFHFQLNTGAFPFISLSFSDSLHGIAGTNNRMIYYTSNGGSTWDSSRVVTPVSYMQAHNVQMADNSTGYAVLSAVNNTVLAKTVNGGQTWSVIKTNTTQFTAAYTALGFVDALHGYIAAFDFNGTPNKFSLLKTNDGGATWAQVNFPSGLPSGISSTQIHALHFNDMQHGWAAGGGTESFIFYTADGGTTWDLQESGTSVSWYAMRFTDSQTGFAAGWYGDIVKTTNGGAIGVFEIQNGGNNDLTIYPNPSNGSVSVHCPSVGNTTAGLKIITMMGKEIYAGQVTSPDFTLDLPEISNGIYLFQITTGNRVIAKKWIVHR